MKDKIINADAARKTVVEELWRVWAQPEIKKAIKSRKLSCEVSFPREFLSAMRKYASDLKYECDIRTSKSSKRITLNLRW